MSQPWLTSDQELDSIWSQLTQTYQRMNSTTFKAEAQYLKGLADMLRIDYRRVTSRYQ